MGTFLLVFLVGGLSTSKFAMGSNEPLGRPTPSPQEAADTHKSDTIIISGPDKPVDAHRDKRKRGDLSEDEL
jgi:hypothetical protein